MSTQILVVDGLYTQHISICVISIFLHLLKRSINETQIVENNIKMLSSLVFTQKLFTYI